MMKLAKREALIPLFSAICRLGVWNASAKEFLITPKVPVPRQNSIHPRFQQPSLSFSQPKFSRSKFDPSVG
jgi:hypothetical protein